MTPFGSSAGVPRRGRPKQVPISFLNPQHLGSPPEPARSPISPAYLGWLVLFSVRRAHDSPPPALWPSLYSVCVSVPPGHLPSSHPQINYGGGGGICGGICQSVNLSICLSVYPSPSRWLGARFGGGATRGLASNLGDRKVPD